MFNRYNKKIAKIINLKNYISKSFVFTLLLSLFDKVTFIKFPIFKKLIMQLSDSFI